jgi:tripartite-type tricarboxylate transporter receptor subunit TctC
MVSRKKSVIVLVVMVVSTVLLARFEAFAQDGYPNKPIEIVVPFEPGGPADLGVRFFVDKWAEFLGQPVIVVNKGGASGAIGGKFVARAKPDGYTLMALNESTLLTAPLLRKDSGYNLDSFRYLWAHSKITAFLSVKADSRWKTFGEFVAEAKKNPGKLKYATWGPNSSSNMVMEMVCEVAGIKLTFVPFKSSPDSLAAVAGGNADIAVTFALSGLGGSGLIRPLVISDDKRVPDQPNVPTLKELGYGIKFVTQYMGIAAPAETPDRIASKLVEAHNKARGKYAREIEEKLPKVDQYSTYLDEKEVLHYLKEREKVYEEFFKKLGSK